MKDEFAEIFKNMNVSVILRKKENVSIAILILTLKEMNDLKVYSEGNNKSLFGCLVAWVADLVVG